MASVWGELKRRNVVKVAVAYAIVGWLLVEVATTVLPTFEAPQWVLQTITFVIVLGFPLALIFAWAYELTPEGLKREEEVDRSESITHQTGRKLDFLIIGVLGIAVIYFVSDKFFWTGEPATLTSVSTEQSIAVLPFVNMSSDPDQEYFSDGIAEDILNQLTKIRGLQVVGRTSSFAFKGMNEDLRVIGKKLNVANILEGSVRKVGNQVRITAQLIKVADGFHLWSDTYDRDLTDIFAIQEEIAKAVAKALSITLGVGEGDLGVGGTRNFDAYDAYLAGIAHMKQFGPEGTVRAIEYLEKAVALDPEFADAWSALAGSYRNGATYYIPERTEELYDKSEAATSRAIEIAPEAVASLIAAASLQKQNRDWTKAEQSLKKALELAPADYRTNLQNGLFLLDVGRPRETIDYYRRAVTSEPLLITPTSGLGFAHQVNRDFDEALKEFDRAKDLIGEQMGLTIATQFLAMAMGDHALLEETLEKLANANSGPRFSQQISRTMLSLLDSPEAARTALHRLHSDPAFNFSQSRGAIGVWASYFDDPELALENYRELFETRRDLIYSLWAPINEKMRRLPAFKDLVRDLGLVDYWRNSGKWGDFCRPLGHDDFECE